ncbi:hypothetical protein F442_07247 [Phytophthora nicotianae P10297]|uniref:Peptidase A2 domain-containing protein n=1 Tax=Phytophthora nicotianae P10297 TaxID=1317064 RepID=W2ZHQ1_PHYNI|nr:hypothetical protein F442_07247 [Phytophthora nicotianae P10297]
MECADADGSISECSFDAVSSAVRDECKGYSKMMKLNPGERQGWWSAKKFDRRIRMRALVQGAVNDHRTRILLDTGANVSVITDTFAKKLRLRDIPDHGRSIDIQGISEGKVSTTRRALVKIMLGWEMVYEFEMWVMAHSAGVDVVLGTDFMIPAGIRLDLFHGAAQLPNEVCIPLIKTKNMNNAVECPPRYLFEIGGKVWLYIERVNPGLSKKLAHRCHGPFRIKRKVEELAYELELPDKSRYLFYPVVHMSRIKAVNEYPNRPKTRLTQDVTEDIRFDFDEELS